MTATIGSRRRGLVLPAPIVDPRSVAGIEHEYVVRVDGRPVDFRTLVADLDLGRAGLDPADHRARRCDWGGSITADGPEAEVVTPPMPIEAGCSGRVADQARRGRAELLAALPEGAELAGFSTHLNVEVPRGTELTTARRVARHAAPALMLLLDRATSPGLLVRPRPGRIEIGGDHVEGDDLRAALVFAIAAVAASRHRRVLPPAPRLEVVRAVERFGWYVDRRALGADLYTLGRATPVELPRGRSTDAQGLLEACWSAARPFAETWADGEELALVDELVAGRRPLPLERDLAAGVPAAHDRTPDPGPTSPFGRAVVARSRNGLRVEPEVATWDVVVLRVSDDGDGPARPAHLATRRRHLAGVVAALDAGLLDRDLRAFLDGPDRGRTLLSADQVGEPALFDHVGDPAGLLPPERHPGTGRLIPSGGDGDRPGKRRSQTPDPSPGVPVVKRSKVLVAVVAAIAAILLIGGAVIALSGGDDDKSETSAADGTGTTRDGPSGSGSASTTTGAPTTTVTGDAPLAGTWRSSNGTVRIRIAGTDAEYTVEILDRPSGGCSDEFTSGTATTISGSGDTYQGIERLRNGATCTVAQERPFTVDVLGPDSIRFNSFPSPTTFVRE